MTLIVQITEIIIIIIVQELLAEEVEEGLFMSPIKTLFTKALEVMVILNIVQQHLFLITLMDNLMEEYIILALDIGAITEILGALGII